MGYAAIYIPEFPTVALLRLEKQATNQAVAVIEGKPPLERVISFNQAANDLGLCHGISKVQAETYDQVVFRPRSVAEEKAAFEQAFEVAERFSPRVQCIASPVNNYANATPLAAVLLLDQSGTGTLFGDAQSYGNALCKALQKLNFLAHVAVAPNAEASLLLARSYTGVTCVMEGEVEPKLAPLPLPVLSVEAHILALLNRWGIRNLGELARLPEEALISRIGQQGRRLQRLARGREDHLLVPHDLPFTLSEHVELDGPLESLESLLFILSPMLERLLRQAINHALAIRSVTITLKLERVAPLDLQIQPAIPVQSKELLLKLINLKLQADSPRAGVIGVTLSAKPAVPQVAQHGLFQSQFPHPDKLGSADRTIESDSRRRQRRVSRTVEQLLRRRVCHGSVSSGCRPSGHSEAECSAPGSAPVSACPTGSSRLSQCSSIRSLVERRAARTRSRKWPLAGEWLLVGWAAVGDRGLGRISSPAVAGTPASTRSRAGNVVCGWPI